MPGPDLEAAGMLDEGFECRCFSAVDAEFQAAEWAKAPSKRNSPVLTCDAAGQSNEWARREASIAVA